jgi:hypothetical protein
MSAGLAVAAVLLVLGAMGLMTCIYRLLPLPVVRGIQLTQGLSFAFTVVSTFATSKTSHTAPLLPPPFRTHSLTSTAWSLRSPPYCSSSSPPAPVTMRTSTSTARNVDATPIAASRLRSSCLRCVSLVSGEKKQRGFERRKKKTETERV